MSDEHNHSDEHNPQEQKSPLRYMTETYNPPPDTVASEIIWGAVGHWQKEKEKEGNKLPLEIAVRAEDGEVWVEMTVKVEGTAEGTAQLKRILDEARLHQEPREHPERRHVDALFLLPDQPLLAFEQDPELFLLKLAIPVTFFPAVGDIWCLIGREPFKFRLHSDLVNRAGQWLAKRNQAYQLKESRELWNAMMAQGALETALSTKGELDQEREQRQAIETRITLIHENTQCGATVPLLAAEYDRNVDTMRYHLNKAKKLGLISDALNLNDKELESFRDYMAQPGKMRRKRQPKGKQS